MMRTTEQLKDSGGLAAIAKMLREQQQQQQQQRQGEEEEEGEREEEKAHHRLRETKNEPPKVSLASSSSPRKREKRRRSEEEENEREKKKRKKREKGEKKEKKKKEAEKDGDSLPPQKEKKKMIRELMDLLARADAFSPDAGFAKNDKTVKTMRAKLKTMMDENVLYFSKQASGIAKNASVTAERVHAWRRAVRGEDATEEEEDGDDDDDNGGGRRERKNELDSILLAFKAMSDVLMAIVSDHSNEESKIEEKFSSPFALQLRALSMKAF
jgi:hypothetical protein